MGPVVVVEPGGDGRGEVALAGVDLGVEIGGRLETSASPRTWYPQVPACWVQATPSEQKMSRSRCIQYSAPPRLPRPRGVHSQNTRRLPGNQ